MLYATEINKLYKTGKQMWRHGAIKEWSYNRTPIRWLLGPCPRCGNSTSNYGGGFSCNDWHCPNSAFVFVCRTPDETPDWWNSDIDVELDGDSWCAHHEDFIDLMESVAGFGNTPQEAVEDYRRQAA